MLKSHRKSMFSLQDLLIISAIFLLQACSQDVDVKHRDNETNRWYTQAQVEIGKAVFIENCALCHGKQAQADDNWRVANEDGSYPAPPLNGSAHAWHHPFLMLKDTIEHGVNQGAMPAWKDKLNNQQIEATIAWFVSHWPEKIYEAWRKRH